MRLIQVAVPVPQLDVLTYAVPPDFPDPAPGARVLVPLGRRVLTGVVISGCGMRVAGSVSSDEAPESGIQDPRTVPAQGPSDPALGTPDPAPRIPDPGTIKAITDILDDAAFLPAD